MKLEAALNDAGDLKQQLELKAQEVRSLSTSIDSLRGANAELEVRLSLPPFFMLPLSLSPTPH